MSNNDMPVVYLPPEPYAAKMRQLVAEETALLRRLGLAKPG